jgi:hypothetical protein
MIRIVGPVKIADDRHHVAEAAAMKSAGEPGDRDPRRLDEGLP